MLLPCSKIPIFMLFTCIVHVLWKGNTRKSKQVEEKGSCGKEDSGSQLPISASTYNHVWSDKSII
jgi:hypothetical protein